MWDKVCVTRWDKVCVDKSVSPYKVKEWRVGQSMRG